MCHGLRTASDGWSYDIDSCSADWTEGQRAAIAKVAELHELPANWLNNDMVSPLNDGPSSKEPGGSDAAWDAHYVPAARMDVPEGLVNDSGDRLLDLRLVRLEAADLTALMWLSEHASQRLGWLGPDPGRLDAPEGAWDEEGEAAMAFLATPAGRAQACVTALRELSLAGPLTMDDVCDELDRALVLELEELVRS